jgi:hypothetical protein
LPLQVENLPGLKVKRRKKKDLKTAWMLKPKRKKVKDFANLHNIMLSLPKGSRR